MAKLFGLPDLNNNRGVTECDCTWLICLLDICSSIFCTSCVYKFWLVWFILLNSFIRRRKKSIIFCWKKKGISEGIHLKLRKDMINHIKTKVKKQNTNVRKDVCNGHWWTHTVLKWWGLLQALHRTVDPSWNLNRTQSLLEQQKWISMIQLCSSHWTSTYKQHV